MHGLSVTDCPTFVTVRISDRGEVRKLLATIEEADIEFEVITIADPCTDDTEPVLVDLSSVTRKQWEAMEIAHEHGHYSQQRGGSLDEIADELGLSTSGVSQRLRSAESHLVDAVLATGRLQCETSDDPK